MKLPILSHHRRESGSVLAVTVVAVGVMGILLASHLSLVSHQRRSVNRSQIWNECIPIAEAGVEEALMNLNINTQPQMTAHGTGWSVQTLAGLGTNVPAITRQLDGDHRYSVCVSGSIAPLIRVEGSVRQPITDQWITRRIEVLTRNTSRFPVGILARGEIEMHGNNVLVDSFDSTDPDYSGLNGIYDSTRRKTNGDIATILGMVDSVKAGNADIWGSATTGPGGTISVGPSGFIKKGSRDDANFDIPDAEVPFNTAAPPIRGTEGGTNYQYYLGTGDYQITGDLSPTGGDVAYVTNLVVSTENVPVVTSSGNGKNKTYSTNWITSTVTNLVVNPIKDAMIITGDARLYVTGSLDLSASYIYIAPNATLEVFVGEGSITLSGNSVFNSTGRATNFSLVGLPEVKEINLSGNAQFTGGIYAPNADLKFNGGGSDVLDFVGGMVVNNITLDGHFNIHYDEALRKRPADSAFVIAGWREY